MTWCGEGEGDCEFLTLPRSVAEAEGTAGVTGLVGMGRGPEEGGV